MTETLQELVERQNRLIVGFRPEILDIEKLLSQVRLEMAEYIKKKITDTGQYEIDENELEDIISELKELK